MVFEEKQSLSKQWWVLVFIPLPIIIIFSVWLGEKDPLEKQELLYAIFIVMAIEALMLTLFLSMRLESRIDRDGVSFRYKPFIRTKKYSWRDIEHAWVRKYKPISEYGGWGIKARNFSGKNIAYNVWGSKGLQLELKDGKKILLGTQKAREMATFLSKLKQNYELAPIREPELNG